MTLRNGFPAVSDAADQFDIRAALRATTAQDANGNIKTGVSITAKSLTGLVTAGNGMNSDIAAFDAVTNRYGPVWLSNDGTISVKHAAAPSANSRIDLICIKQNETASPASDPTDGPEAIIVTGTPAVDPVTPATPEGALALARVTIPSTATSMTSTEVIYEQMYPFTASAGADLLFRSETEKDAWTPWEGQKCRLLDGNEYQAKSGVWVSLTPVTGRVKMPYSDRYITLVRVGRIVTACAYITLTSNFNQVGNTSVNETIPEGFRPSGDSRAVMRGTDNSGATSFYLYGTADGKMVLNGTGYTSRFVGISGCWITE